MENCFECNTSTNPCLIHYDKRMDGQYCIQRILLNFINLFCRDGYKK